MDIKTLDRIEAKLYTLHEEVERYGIELDIVDLRYRRDLAQKSELDLIKRLQFLLDTALPMFRVTGHKKKDTARRAHVIRKALNVVYVLKQRLLTKAGQ